MARGKSFTVYAATETEKQEWMLHINRCVTDLYKRMIVFTLFMTD